jgi:DNA-directed RNA polymerase beta' subunit
LSCSQEPSTGSYPESNESRPNPHPVFLRSILILLSQTSNALHHICYFPFKCYVVTYRPVAKWWLCKQRPLLGNARNNRRTVFSVGPCRGDISGTKFRA